ncbi:MAG TPA: ParB/RepB/Spo0J family partition protein [Acidimicrobiales bacterium]|nr:ParB/RepB/Spo0J family partition protein [Acidimicrobiales bacterium]
MATRKAGLGRGLGALIPTETPAAGGGTSLQEIATSDIEPNRYQPREHFDEESLASLTASVRELGVLQPILVRPAAEPGRYELIAGERRWRAAKRAGLPSVPAIVREVDDLDSLEQAVVENLHRQDLNPLEEAAAYQQLIEDFDLTQERLAERVGKSRSAVANTLRLFQLPPSIQKLVAEDQLSAGHARALLGTPDRAFQEGLAKRAVAQGLSVREVEDAVRRREADKSEDEGSPPVGALRPAGLLELEELLASHLDTRVAVTMGARKGRVVIDFATLEDLERIYRAMVHGRPGDPEA